MASSLENGNKTPCLDIIQDFPSVPPLGRFGKGAFNDVRGSDSSAKAPIVCGIWYPDDVENGTEVVEIPGDEVKYVVAGESRWKCATTGRIFHGSVGSMIWLPKGAKVIRQYSKGLKTFYVEQDYRAPTALDDPATVHLPQLDFIHNDVLTKYRLENPKSLAQFQQRLAVFPGATTRSVLHYEPFPLAMSGGKGCWVTSVDGREYLDFVSEYSAAMFGHSHPDILAAIREALERGINLGAPGEHEVQLATAIKARFRSIDKIRFCNSGTEANTMALALAVNYTGRKKILAFQHGYHGSFASFSSQPLPATVPHQYVLGKYNDIEHTRSLLSGDIAAIIVEPMQGVGGMIPATNEFLQFLRESATTLGALLIFDEVVTSRLHINGLQQHFGVSPDLTTLGKYIGGGSAFGAFGGRGAVMDQLDSPAGISHSGTYNNNALTMAAGVAASKVLTEEKIREANRLGDKLREGINSAAREYTTQLIHATGFGSAVGLHFKGAASDRLRDTLFFFLLSKNIYVGRRGFISLNIMHEEKHVDQFLDAFATFLSEVLKGKDWLSVFTANGG